MGRLRLNEFTVKKATESGQDSPYFVFFLARLEDKTSNVIAVRQTHWDNEASAGDTFRPNTAIIANYTEGTVVLCALMEEDDNADVVTGGGAINKVKTYMHQSFKEYSKQVVMTRDNLAGHLMPEFRRTLDHNVTNDDVVDIHSVHINPAVGTIEKDMRFEGDDGKYLVTFEVIT